MAFKFRAPNLTGVAGKTEVVAPQGPSAGALAISGALSAAQRIAEGFRDHNQTVDRANAAASFFDRIGSPRESEAYRTAATVFKPEFFKDPTAYAKANAKITDDLLAAVGNSYDREYKEQLLKLRAREVDVKDENADNALAVRERNAATREAEVTAKIADLEAKRTQAATAEERRAAEQALKELKFEQAKVDNEKKFELREREIAIKEKLAEIKERQFKSVQDAQSALAQTAQENGWKAVATKDGRRITYVDPSGTPKVSVVQDFASGDVKIITTGLTQEGAIQEAERIKGQPNPSTTPIQTDVRKQMGLPPKE